MLGGRAVFGEGEHCPTEQSSPSRVSVTSSPNPFLLPSSHILLFSSKDFLLDVDPYLTPSFDPSAEKGLKLGLKQGLIKVLVFKISSFISFPQYLAFLMP